MRSIHMVVQGDNAIDVRIFVSHAGPDTAWAEWVAWQLQVEGYAVELDAWHWRAGDDFVERMRDAVERSGVLMIALWSAQYFDARHATRDEWSAIRVAMLQGDPTEIALAEGSGPDLPARLAARDERRRALFRFDARLRMMSTVAQHDGRFRVYVKGAPEAVLARTSGADRDAVMAVVADLAQRGLRVLAVAVRDLPPGAGAPARREDAEAGLRLLGLAGLYDPPRPQVAGAVRRCHDAGLRVHIVTGDNGATAAAVAAEVGIGVGALDVLPSGGLSSPLPP
ncbi:toll/interleukin-1 receptor domain-containing protein [Actinomadura soli]|uniref:toll/interleukin-1 receptor domain-containing protein n=1 Tax=Actinomadura soli TaxID=2508997 RepID=UPI00197A81D4|nr:toll/interleukin-1 receptor domain-containing protein [Actinomadura soli]